MPDMDITVQAKSAVRDVWLMGDYPIRTAECPDLDDAIALGQLDVLDHTPRFVKHNYGKRLGDLLWTTGGSVKLASRRLVDTFNDLSVTAFSTFDVEIVHPLIEPGQYVGLAVTGARGKDSVYQLHDYAPHWGFGIEPGLLEALKQRGVDAFEVGDFDPYYAVDRRDPDDDDDGDDWDDDWDDD